MDAGSTKVETKQWRCPGCGLLLGMRNGREMEIRYKDARYVVAGMVRATCRRCGRETSTATAWFPEKAA